MQWLAKLLCLPSSLTYTTKTPSRSLSTHVQVSFSLVVIYLAQDSMLNLVTLKALGYIVHTISWVLNVVIVLGLIATGFSADLGHTWAEGPHPYQTIWS